MLVLADNGRGAHAKLRSTTHRYWPLDENDLGAVTCLVSGDVLDSTTLGTTSYPLVFDSPIGGRCRRFVNADQTFLYGSGDATSRDIHEGEFTVSFWIRLHEDPPENGRIYAYTGSIASETAANNTLKMVGVDTNRQIILFWENGAGINAISGGSPFSPVLELHRWYFVSVRWTNATNPGTDPAPGVSGGGGGTVDVDLYLNGALVDGASSGNASFQGLDNCSDGGSAYYVIGAQSNVTLQSELSADLAGIYVEGTALSQEEIEEDFRRGLMLNFFHRLDIRVGVENGDGDMVDLTDYMGEDFVKSATVNPNVDQACAALDVDLFRESGGLSLALLKTDTGSNLTDVTDVTSYSPLIDVVRSIQADTARVPLGVRATSRDFAPRIVGKIDDVDWGSGDSVKVKARDGGGALVDAYIEEEVKNSGIDGEQPDEFPSYGSTSGTAVEGEMQKILDDNDNNSANNTVAGLTVRTGSYDPISLYTPRTPAWFVLPWRQRREPVMTAMRSLAAQIGWDLRFVFDPNPNVAAWRLTFKEPNREDVAPHVLLREGEIYDVSRASIRAQEIRNVVRVPYLSSEPAGTTPTTAASTIEATLDERYESWGIDANGNRQVAYIEVWDTASIAKYGRRFMEIQEGSTSQIDTIDEAQRLAIAAVRDLREPDFTHGVTSIPMPELDINSIFRFDSNVELFTGQQQLAGVNLRHTLGADGSSSIEARGAPTVGVRRWLQLEARPGLGRPPVINPLDALTDVNIGGLLQVVSGLVERTDYLTGGKFTGVKNSDFAVWSRGEANAPDGWRPVGASGASTTWGVGAEIETSDTVTSSRAVRITLADNRVQSDFIPIMDGQPYMGESTTRRTNGADSPVRLDVIFYQLDRSTIVSTVTWTPTGWSGTGWETIRRAFEAPSNARFARVQARSPASLAGDILVDRLNVYRIAHEAEVMKSANQGINVANAWELWEFDDDSTNQTDGDGPHDYGAIADTVNHWFKVKEHGFYEFGVSMGFTTNAAGTINVGVRIQRNGTTVAEQSCDKTYTPTILNSRLTVAKSMHLEPGDQITIDGQMNNAAGTINNSTRAWCKLRLVD